MKTILTILLAAIYTLQATAQVGAGLVGEVFEMEPGRTEKTHLPYSTITLENTKGEILGTTANWDGTYYMSNVPPGQYKLRVSHVGRETIERDIQLEAGTLQTFDAEMQTSLMQTTDVVQVIAEYPAHWDHHCSCVRLPNIPCSLPCRLKKFEAKTKGLSAWMLTASLIGGYALKTHSINPNDDDDKDYK